MTYHVAVVKCNTVGLLQYLLLKAPGFLVACDVTYVHIS